MNDFLFLAWSKNNNSPILFPLLIHIIFDEVIIFLVVLFVPIIVFDINLSGWLCIFKDILNIETMCCVSLYVWNFIFLIKLLNIILEAYSMRL